MLLFREAEIGAESNATGRISNEQNHVVLALSFKKQGRRQKGREFD